MFPKRFEYIELINITVEYQTQTHTLLTNHHFYRIPPLHPTALYRSTAGFFLHRPTATMEFTCFTLLGQWAGCRLVVDKNVQEACEAAVVRDAVFRLLYCGGLRSLRGRWSGRMEMAKAEREASRFL